MDHRVSLRGFRDPRKNPEKGAFPRSVSADDPEHFTLFDIERYTVKRPDRGVVLPLGGVRSQTASVEAAVAVADRVLLT